MNPMIALACSILLSTPATAQTPVGQSLGYGPPIGVEEAMAVISKGMKNAASGKHKMAFAVVEPSGELVAFARMDDTPYASIRLAQQKARTAARLRVSTAELERRVQGGRTVLLSSDEVLAVAGGVLIIKHGRIVGALGVSGATAPEDASIAESALIRP
jgi:glc operon protein GlcG